MANKEPINDEQDERAKNAMAQILTILTEKDISAYALLKALTDAQNYSNLQKIIEEQKQMINTLEEEKLTHDSKISTLQKEKNEILQIAINNMQIIARSHTTLNHAVAQIFKNIFGRYRLSKHIKQQLDDVNQMLLDQEKRNIESKKNGRID